MEPALHHYDALAGNRPEDQTSAMRLNGASGKVRDVLIGDDDINHYAIDEGTEARAEDDPDGRAIGGLASDLDDGVIDLL
jgi:hypothetical protein